MLKVKFYFAVGSRYSYLASSQIEALEAESGCVVDWLPLNSVRLLATRHANPFDGEPVSGQYEWAYREKDAARWAAFYEIPWVEPRGRVEFDSELLARACTAAKRLNRVEAYARALFSVMFAGSAARIDASECIRQAKGCGLSGRDFERELESSETQTQLEATMSEANVAGVFGVPTFIVNGELFWGNDRLVLLKHYLNAQGSARTAGPLAKAHGR